MRIKVKLRAVVTLFRLEKEPIRGLFKDVLKEETLDMLEKKYPTLSEFQEADKRVLVALTNERLYEKMKEALSEYVNELFAKCANISNSEYLLPTIQLAYGRMAEDAEIYSRPFIEVQNAIESLSDEMQKFLSLYYSYNGNRYTDDEIKQRLNLSVPIEEYKSTVLERLRDNLH